MKSLKIVSLVAILMGLLVALSLAQAQHGHEPNVDQEAQELRVDKHHQGPSRFFKTKERTGVRPRAIVTCDTFPRICHVKGSPGHDCCRKKCVNVKIDNYNCGMCGNKCRYPEICCNGRCVNTLHDRKNCGGCHNKCTKGSFCNYGMCSYA